MCDSHVVHFVIHVQHFLPFGIEKQRNDETSYTILGIPLLDTWDVFDMYDDVCLN